MNFKTFWAEFLENVDMVFSYQKACEGLASFLRVHGIPKIELPNMDKAITLATKEFIVQERYELCSWLGMPFKMEAHPLAIDRVVKEIKVIVLFDDNSQVMFEVLKEMGMFAFTNEGLIVHTTKTGIDLIEILLRQRSNQPFHRFILLNNIKRQLSLLTQ